MLLDEIDGTGRFRYDEGGVLWYYFGKKKPNRTRALIQDCLNCKKQFAIMPRMGPDNTAYRNKFCSKRCSGAYLGARGMLAEKGENSHRWKGGRHIVGSGYVEVWMPDHPFCRGGRYVREHRLVMEKHLGRYLQPWEQVHHKNGIKGDNRLENLELISGKVHIGEVTCPHCGGSFVIR